MKKLINQCIEFFYFPIFRFMPLPMFKYAACGGTTVMVDLVAYYIAYNYLFKREVFEIAGISISPHIAAFLVAFAISFPVGFLLNKYIVFTTSALKGRIQLFRYMLAVGSTLAQR